MTNTDLSNSRRRKGRSTPPPIDLQQELLQIGIYPQLMDAPEARTFLQKVWNTLQDNATVSAKRGTGVTLPRLRKELSELFGASPEEAAHRFLGSGDSATAFKVTLAGQDYALKLAGGSGVQQTRIPGEPPSATLSKLQQAIFGVYSLKFSFKISNHIAYSAALPKGHIPRLPQQHAILRHPTYGFIGIVEELIAGQTLEKALLSGAVSADGAKNAVSEVCRHVADLGMVYFDSMHLRNFIFRDSSAKQLMIVDAGTVFPRRNVTGSQEDVLATVFAKIDAIGDLEKRSGPRK